MSHSATAQRNYRRLLEESNLPIEIAVEIADLVDKAQSATPRMIGECRQCGYKIVADDTPLSERATLPMDGVHQRVAKCADLYHAAHSPILAETHIFYQKALEHLQRQIGYIATELMVAGDKRSLPEIVETAAEATATPYGNEESK